MAKYVQPTFDVYGVAQFFNQVTLDTSVFIAVPSTSILDTPYALVIDSASGKPVVKTRQLGSMAWRPASDLDDVSTRLNTAEGEITQLGTDVGDVSTRVNTNTTNITTNTGDITQLGTDVGDVSTRLNTSEGDITQLGTDIGDVSTRVNTNTTNITTNTGDITQLGTDIGDVSTRVNTNTTNITTNTGDITQLGTDVGDVSTRVQTNEGDITQLGTDVGDVSTRVQTLEGASGNYVLKAGDTMTGPLEITGGGLTVGETGDQYDVSIYGGLYVHNGATIGGDLYVDGSLYVTNVESIDVSAGFIHLNTGLTGTPPASMQAGIEIGRGDLDPYVFIFDESRDEFRIGIAERLAGPSYNDASTQAVATREDTPTTDALPFWNETAARFDTTANLTYTANKGFQIDSSLIINNLTDFGQEATALVKNGFNQVGAVELGTMAFATAADFALATDVADVSTRLNTAEGDITQLGTDIGDVSTRVNTNTTNITTNTGDITQLGTDIGDVSTRVNTNTTNITTNTGDITQLGTDVGDVSTRVQTNEGDITQLGTDIGDVSTRVNTNTTNITTNTGDITQLGTDIGDVSTRVNTNTTNITQLGTDVGDVSTRVNTNTTNITTNTGDITQLGTDVGDVSTRVNTIETDFIDSVADTTSAVGGVGIYAGEANNTAYLKQLVEGSGTTITSDASTITIGVTSAEGYAEKYVGTFNSDGSTSMTIPDASLGFTSSGPFHVTVYESNLEVQLGVNISGTDIVLSWTTGSLSGVCDVIVTG